MDTIDILSKICTRDESGRHYTEIYPEDVLAELETAGLIEVYRPVHDATGIPYDLSYWVVHVTEAGQAVVDAQ